MSEAAWLRRTDIPAPRTEKKLLEFFGIPPDGYDQLEANIARKRRRWHSMKSGVSPQGRQRAEAVLRLIHSGSETLLRLRFDDFTRAWPDPMPPPPGSSGSAGRPSSSSAPRCSKRR